MDHLEALIKFKTNFNRRIHRPYIVVDLKNLTEKSFNREKEIVSCGVGCTIKEINKYLD